MQNDQELHSQSTRCCIAGCGPAGAMLGFLLARRGVERQRHCYQQAHLLVPVDEFVASTGTH